MTGRRIVGAVRRRVGGNDVREWRGATAYWREHYATGGNSGSGSYGRLAAFKADVLNKFVADHGVGSVIELGCGDGNQLSLATYPTYVGLDVSEIALEMCIRRFPADPSKSFYLYRPECTVDNAGLFQAELAMSLDVVYHLIEPAGYESYMKALVAAGEKWLVIFGPDTDDYAPHVSVKARKFTRWIDDNAPDWELHEHIPNRFKYTGDPKVSTPADFYFFRRVEQAG